MPSSPQHCQYAAHLTTANAQPTPQVTANAQRTPCVKKPENKEISIWRFLKENQVQKWCVEGEVDTGDIDPERTANEEVREHGAGRGGRQVLVDLRRRLRRGLRGRVVIMVNDCMGV